MFGVFFGGTEKKAAPHKRVRFLDRVWALTQPRRVFLLPSGVVNGGFNLDGSGDGLLYKHRLICMYFIYRISKLLVSFVESRRETRWRSDGLRRRVSPLPALSPPCHHVAFSSFSCSDCFLPFAPLVVLVVFCVFVLVLIFVFVVLIVVSFVVVLFYQGWSHQARRCCIKRYIRRKNIHSIIVVSQSKSSISRSHRRKRPFPMPPPPLSWPNGFFPPPVARTPAFCSTRHVVEIQVENFESKL
jgi:hypothetical protein